MLLKNYRSMQTSSMLTRTRKSLLIIFFIPVLLTFFLTILSQHEAQSGQATLSWNPPFTYTNGTELRYFPGFKVYYGTSSCNYSEVINAGYVTSYTVSDLADGLRYYFAVTAYDGYHGIESGYSNEVSISIGSPIINGKCAAELSACLGLYIPIIDFNGTYLFGDLTCELTTDGSIICRVTQYGVVDPQNFADCQASTLTAQLELHIPAGTYGNTSYQADFHYVPTVDGQIWFQLTDVTQN